VIYCNCKFSIYYMRLWKLLIPKQWHSFQILSLERTKMWICSEFGPLDQTWTVVRYVNSLTIVIDMIAGTGSLSAVIFLQCKAIDSITIWQRFVWAPCCLNSSLNWELGWWSTTGHYLHYVLMNCPWHCSHFLKRATIHPKTNDTQLKRRQASKDETYRAYCAWNEKRRLYIQCKECIVR
jgi:hypothetical protein